LYTEGNSKGRIREGLRTDLERIKGRDDGHVDINSNDMRGKWKPELWDFEESDDDVDLAEWRAEKPDFDIDDDIDVTTSEGLLDRQGPTEEGLDFFRKALNSVREAYDRNLEKGISIEETGNRLYYGEEPVQE
jgi:hypothetical protein